MKENNLLERVGARKSPVIFGRKESENYANRIFKNANLENHRNLCLKKLTKMIPEDLTGRSAIDIGCGEGRWSRFLALRGANVLAVDSSSEMIHIAKERCKEFSQIEFKSLPFGFYADPKWFLKFDFAIASYITNNVTDLKKFFQVVTKILRAKGILFILTKTFVFNSQQIELEMKGMFLPVKIYDRFTMYTAARSIDYYIETAKACGLEKSDYYCRKSNDCFENNECNEYISKIEDHIIKFVQNKTALT